MNRFHVLEYCQSCTIPFDLNSHIPRTMYLCNHYVCQQCIHRVAGEMERVYFQEIFDYQIPDGEVLNIYFKCPVCQGKQIKFIDNCSMNREEAIKWIADKVAEVFFIHWRTIRHLQAVCASSAETSQSPQS